MSFCGRQLLLGCFIAISLGYGFVAAQEKTDKVTIEEVISRHEATWAKLSRYSVQIDAKGQGLSEEPIVKPVRIVTKDLDSRVFLCTDSDRYISIESTAKEGASYKRTHKNIHQDDHYINVIHIRGVQGTATIRKRTEGIEPLAHYLVGSTISKAHYAPSRTLRAWVEGERPSIEQTSNKVGQTIYVLKGRFTTEYEIRQKKLVEIDQLEVVVNIDRGYLIERLAFTSPKQAAASAKSTIVWEVCEWLDIGGGLFFPSRIHTESTYWNNDKKDFWDFSLSGFTTSPTDLEKTFANIYAENDLIFDHTGKQGAAKLSIWGPDGKAKKTYDDGNIYMQEEAAKQLVAKFFQGYKVEVVLGQSGSDFQTLVRSDNGEIVHDFKTRAELEAFIKIKGK